MSIKLNPLIESIGPLKGGLRPNSLKMKAEIKEALVKKFGEKGKKMAEKFRTGGAVALDKKTADKVAQAFKERGLFKYEENDIPGQVSSILRGQKKAASEKGKNSQEKKLARVRQRQAMDRAWGKNQPQGLTNQLAAGATPTVQPTFASPLPATALPSPAQGQPTTPFNNPFEPQTNNNPQPADRSPITPAEQSAPQPAKNEPRDLQID